MKVWITKYALTTGIQVVQGVEFLGGDHIRIPFSHGAKSFFGTDWHNSEDRALERAEEMRTKKIASLERQIQNLKKRTFKPEGRAL